MVKIKMTTSLYHSNLGILNVGQVLDIDTELANKLVDDKMARVLEQEQTPIATKKKTVKKGD